MLCHGLARIILLARWQVLTGTIAKSAPEGLWLSVGFFENIFVPPHFMQDGSEWDAAQELWVWKSVHGEAALDPRLGSAVRFRVTNSIFRQEQRPLEAPPAANADARDSGGQGEQPPFQVMASIKDDGLGLVMWWE
jgi:DNA-directed RNA polymerase III subunit RPC8